MISCKGLLSLLEVLLLLCSCESRCNVGGRCRSGRYDLCRCVSLGLSGSRSCRCNGSGCYGILFGFSLESSFESCLLFSLLCSDPCAFFSLLGCDACFFFGFSCSEDCFLSSLSGETCLFECFFCSLSGIFLSLDGSETLVFFNSLLLSDACFFLGLTCESACFLSFLLSVYRFDLSGVDSGLCFFDCCLGSYAGLFLCLSCCNLCVFLGLLESCKLGSFLSLLVSEKSSFLSFLRESLGFFSLSLCSLCLLGSLECGSL